MQWACRLAAWAVVASLTAPAAAQDRTPGYTAQDFIHILKPAPTMAKERPLGEAAPCGPDLREHADFEALPQAVAEVDRAGAAERVSWGH